MKTISLDEALKINFSNHFHKDRLEKDKIQFDLINQFHPCECVVKIEGINDNTYHEGTSFYLKNDVCKIGIRYDEYRKKYHIYLDERFTNATHYTRNDVEKKLQEPKHIGVLTSKKIQDWITYCQTVYKEMKRIDEQRSDNITNFLKSIENEQVNWYNNKQNGEIIKNGIKFSFSINDGFVSKKIEVYYSVENTFENFKKISDNKL